MAADVRFDDERMYVRLVDGCEISVPLTWFPRLSDATPEQRGHWRLIGRGVGIHWEEVDEDVSVPICWACPATDCPLIATTGTRISTAVGPACALIGRCFRAERNTGEQ